MVLVGDHDDAMADADKPPQTGDDEHPSKRRGGVVIIKVEGKLQDEGEGNDDQVQHVEGFLDEVLGLETNEDQAQLNEEDAQDGNGQGEEGDVDVVQPLVLVLVASGGTGGLDASAADGMMVVITAALGSEESMIIIVAVGASEEVASLGEETHFVVAVGIASTIFGRIRTARNGFARDDSARRILRAEEQFDEQYHDVEHEEAAEGPLDGGLVQKVQDFGLPRVCTREDIG